MSQEQLPVLHQMNTLLIQKYCFTEVHNVVDFQELLTCRSHTTGD